MSIKESCLKLEDIKDGDIIHRAAPMYGNIVQSFIIVGEPYDNYGSPFIKVWRLDERGKKRYFSDKTPYIIEHSLKDFGIIPQDYNGSLCFTTRSKAWEWIQTNDFMTPPRLVQIAEEREEMRSMDMWMCEELER